MPFRTESDLIAAMKDPRYWKVGEPGREDHIEAVTKGWERLFEDRTRSETSLVHVKEHTRENEGKLVHVDAYDRHPPEKPDDGAVQGGEQSVSSRVIECEIIRIQDEEVCRSGRVRQEFKAQCWKSVYERNALCRRGLWYPPLFMGY